MNASGSRFSLRTGDSQFDENMRRLWFFLIGVLLGVAMATILWRPELTRSWNAAVGRATWCDGAPMCPALRREMIFERGAAWMKAHPHFHL